LNYSRIRANPLPLFLVPPPLLPLLLDKTLGLEYLKRRGSQNRIAQDYSKCKKENVFFFFRIQG